MDCEAACGCGCNIVDLSFHKEIVNIITVIAEVILLRRWGCLNKKELWRYIIIHQLRI